MFLVQYSLGVKRDEMRKLEEIALSEEKRIEAAEKYLEEDAALFDEFLKENGNNSTQAVKIAEEETRKKTEKTNEIKKLNTQIMILRSEINKMEDTLKEYQMYKNFLDRVTPFLSLPQTPSACSAFKFFMRFVFTSFFNWQHVP